MKHRTLFLWLVPAVALGVLAVWHERTAPHWRDLGMSLRQQGKADFFAPLDARSVNMEDFLEQGDTSLFLWAYGPAVEITFQCIEPLELELGLRYESPIADQRLTVTANGNPLALPDADQPRREPAAGQTPGGRFRSVVGSNTIRIAFERWNHHGTEFAPGDPRPMALRVTGLRLALAPASEDER